MHQASQLAFGLFLVRKRCGFEVDLVEVFGCAIGHAGLEDRPHPGVTRGFGDLGREGLQLLARDALGNLGIDPGLAAILGEEVALDLAAGGEVICFACELRHRRGRADRAVGDHPADGICLVALPGVRELVPHQHLAFVVGGRCVGLGDIQGDLAFLECGEDRISEVGEAQAAFDEPAGAAKPLGNRVEVAALIDEVLVGPDFIGRGHVEPDDVLDQREFGLLGGIDVEHAAGDGVILGELARLEEKVQCSQAATTGGHIKHAPLLGWRHDQVLKEALGLDVGGEFLDEEVAVILADVGLGQA